MGTTTVMCDDTSTATEDVLDAHDACCVLAVAGQHDVDEGPAFLLQLMSALVGALHDGPEQHGFGASMRVSATEDDADGLHVAGWCDCDEDWHPALDVWHSTFGVFQHELDSAHGAPPVFILSCESPLSRALPHAGGRAFPPFDAQSPEQHGLPVPTVSGATCATDKQTHGRKRRLRKGVCCWCSQMKECGVMGCMTV